MTTSKVWSDVSPAGMLSDEHHRVRCHLGALLDGRGMTLTQLAELSVANLSIVKNDRARAVRLSTLTLLGNG